MAFRIEYHGKTVSLARANRLLSCMCRRIDVPYKESCTPERDMFDMFIDILGLNSFRYSIEDIKFDNELRTIVEFNSSVFDVINAV